MECHQPLQSSPQLKKQCLVSSEANSMVNRMQPFWLVRSGGASALLTPRDLTLISQVS
jgi:hypothetical protein